MKLFISWSGAASRDVATSLRKYLPIMLPGLKVFMSQHDLESGSRWGDELARELDDSSFGVICLTRENLLSPWLMFEAGAVTKHLDGRACSLLLNGLRQPDVPMPLAQFQNRVFSKDEFIALLRDLNRRLDPGIEGEHLAVLFDKFWPDLEHEYTVLASKRERHPVDGQPRDQREILEEILLRIRDLNPGTANLQSSLQAPTGGDVLERPLGYDSLGWYTVSRFPHLPISEFWQSQILNDLDPARYALIRDVDDAVTRALDAVSAYASEAPGLFMHGTDFISKSLGFIDDSFRRDHGFGSNTRQAFAKYAHLVRPAQRRVDLDSRL